MECAERSLLLELCATTMHAYTKASIRWQRLTGTNSKEYRDSLIAREQARAQVEIANFQLEQHERVHQCFPVASTLN